jgi:hypothetical protein
MASNRKISESLPQLTSPAEPEGFLSASDYKLGKRCIKQLVIDPDDEIFKYYKQMQGDITAKLFRIFETFENVIPYQQRKTINVISLGCGKPLEFLALNEFLKIHNPSCTLKYIGVDINQENIDKIAKQYQKFSNANFLTADVSNPFILKKALIENNIFPENGFDIIFLRHPEMLSTQAPSFKKMISDSIPYFSHEKSLVFISAFLDAELVEIEQCLKSSSSYNIPTAKNKLYNSDRLLDKEKKKQEGLQDIEEPETHTILMHCSGYSLGVRTDAAHEKLLQRINKLSVNKPDADTMTAINSRQYNLALRKVSAKLQLSMLKILLDFKWHLTIDVNAPSSNKKTALDWVLSCKKPDVYDQRDAKDLLLAHGAKESSAEFTVAVSLKSMMKPS